MKHAGMYTSKNKGNNYAKANKGKRYNRHRELSANALKTHIVEIHAYINLDGDTKLYSVKYDNGTWDDYQTLTKEYKNWCNNHCLETRVYTHDGVIKYTVKIWGKNMTHNDMRTIPY